MLRSGSVLLSGTLPVIARPHRPGWGSGRRHGHRTDHLPGAIDEARDPSLRWVHSAEAPLDAAHRGAVVRSIVEHKAQDQGDRASRSRHRVDAAPVHPGSVSGDS